MSPASVPQILAISGIVVVGVVAAVFGVVPQDARTANVAEAVTHPELPQVEPAKSWANGLTTTKYCLEGQAVWHLKHGPTSDWVPAFKNGVPEGCSAAK